MPQSAQVDPRGLRVVAGITTVVLALVLVTPEPLKLVLLAIQVAVFAVAALIGLRQSPYSVLFATVVRPRLGPPTHLEDSRPPRFAQAVGLAFTTGALIAFLLGATTVGLVATAFALVAALLNASVGLCLGCELYLAVRRLTPARG
ncbi:MAG: hypothetical protein JWP31_1328 [Aeromicrobium sp.]|nr:hypothetical protein [Aeromicrobium sp.]